MWSSASTGRERFTRGASHTFKYQLSLFHQNQMKPPRHRTHLWLRWRQQEVSPALAVGAERQRQPESVRCPTGEQPHVSHLSCAARRLGLLSPPGGCSAFPLCNSNKKLTLFSAATDPSRETDILLQSFMLPLAKTVFICVCVLRKGTQRDDGKSCRSTGEDTEKDRTKLFPISPCCSRRCMTP